MKDKLMNMKSRADKLQIFRLIAVIFLLFVGFSTESYSLSQAFFIMAYFITVFEGLYKSFIAVSKKDFFNDDVLFSVSSLFALVLGIANAALIANLYYYSVYIQRAIIKYKQDSFTMNSENNIEHVNIVNEFGAVSVSTPDNIKKGDVIVVNPGECIITDGIITDGFSTVNTESVTSDSEPLEVAINDKVLAGYVNLTAPITYKSRCDVNSTHIEAIKKLASESVSNASKSFGFVRRYSNISSAIILFVALIMLLASVFSDVSFEPVVVLIITSGMVTLKNIYKYLISDSVYTGVRNGILFKNGNSVVNLSAVSTVIIEFKNKIGDFIVASAEIYDEYSEDNLKDIASCLYSKSSLPYADAICKYVGIIDSSSRISGYRELDHSGCFAYLDGHQIVSGTTEFMKKSKIHLPFADEPDFAGIHFAVDGTYIGNIRFEYNDFYKLSKAVSDMRCCGIKHFVIFGTEDSVGAERLRSSLNVDYFSVNDDRTKIINDIMNNVAGKIAIFGRHDWLVSGVESVYLGSGCIDNEFIDADVAVAGKSVSHVSDVIKISDTVRNLTKVMVAALLAFKLIISVVAICGHASAYFVIIAELIMYVLLSFLSSLTFKRI